MTIDIRSQDVVISGGLRAHVAQRLLYTLRPVAQHLLRVTVDVKNVDSPHRRGDKLCRIMVAMPRSGTVVVEVVDADLHAAIDRATERLGYIIMRELGRREHASSTPLVSRISASALFRRLERVRI